MTWTLLAVIAYLLGTDAAHKLNRPHPTPAAWFEVALTFVLIVAALITYLLKDED